MVNSLLKSDRRFYEVDPSKCIKSLCLPFEVKHKPLPEYFRKITTFCETYIEGKYFDINFINLLKKHNLYIFTGRLFLNYPHYRYSLHTDIQQLGDQTVALNFPFDDEGTTFTWYKLQENKQGYTKLNQQKVEVLYFDVNDCDVVLSTEPKHNYAQPLMINTGYIHSLCVKNTHRYCYSYFLRKIGSKPFDEKNQDFLQWDEAVELFKEYIV